MTEKNKLNIEPSNFFNHSVSSDSTNTNKEIFIEQGGLSNISKICIQNKWYLLKRIKPEKSNHPAYITAFDKEFDIGFECEHPNIVKYISKGEDENGHYILMEFVDGKSLRSIINENRKIHNKQILHKIIKQLLEVLSYLHSKQIYHLDLKPENILLTNKGNNIKLIDFGFADTDSYMNALGGSKKYSAPEQLANPQLADGRSDLFSLGIIILELFTGTSELMFINQLPQQLQKIVKKCTEIAPDKRFQSADEVLNVLLKPSRTKQYIFAGFLFTTFIIILFLLIQNANQNKINKSKILNINSILTKQAVQQDSTFKNIKKEINNSIISTIVLNDSIQCVNLGKELYENFINGVSHLDTTSHQNKKLQLISLMNSCVKKNLNKWNTLSIKFSKGTSKFYTANRVFSTYHDSSLAMIRKYIYTSQ